MGKEQALEQEHGTELEIVDVEAEGIRPATISEQILQPLTLSDYSQFLYETNYGGKRGQDFTFEGIKTLGIANGISTSAVRVEFLNDEKTEALFYCTATDRNGDTSDVVVKQCENEHGRINPNWVEKGCGRAMRNAIKARLPVQLFKTALQKAIAAGEAKQSEIIQAQKALGVAWSNRGEYLKHIEKRAFFMAAQSEYGEVGEWDAETYSVIRADLENKSEWVASLNGS